VKSWLVRVMLALVGIVACVAIGVALEDEAGIPFATTYRFACAGACLFFIARIGRDCLAARWRRIALLAVLVANIGLFFTPLVDRPASRGEIMLFALPDAAIFLIIVLIARIRSRPAADDHERAVRQQLIFGIVVALAFGALLFGLLLVPPHPG
jgi:drug/metabolite transporter (DMT)-like permease